MKFRQENIYFITLINNKQRKNNVDNIIKNFLPNSNIFEAVDRKNLNPIEINKYIEKGFLTKKYVDRVFRNQKNLGAVGCTLSHMTLWQKLINSDDKYYIIIEDDTNLMPNFIENMKKIFKDFKKLSKKMEYITFFIHPHFEKKQKEWGDKFKENSKYISKCMPMYGAVCYLITKKGAKKIFNFLKNRDNIRETDTIINNMIQQNLLNAYCCNLNMVRTLGAVGKKDFINGNSLMSSTVWGND